MIEQLGLSGPSWPAFLVPGCLAFFAVLLLGYVGKKLSYERTEYNFYADRLEFDTGFFAVSRKVIPYRDVKEVSLREGFLRRTCGLGTVYLGTLTTGTIPSSNPFLAFGWVNASASGAALRDISDPSKGCKIVTPSDEVHANVIAISSVNRHTIIHARQATAAAKPTGARSLNQVQN